jgi:hypothetical protein
MECVDEKQLNTDIINLIMKLLLENHQEVTVWIISLTCTTFNQSYIDLSIDNSYSDYKIRQNVLATFAAEHGYATLLQYAFDLGCEKNEWIFNCVAFSGDLQLLKCLYDSGCPCDYSASGSAVKAGHENILRWMMKNDLPIARSLLCSSAVDGGHFILLKKLRMEGFEWGRTLYSAVKNGHLNIFEWALKNGCSWSCEYMINCVCIASEYGELKFLIWLAENNYDFDKNTAVIEATINGQVNIVQYFLKTDIEWMEKIGCILIIEHILFLSSRNDMVDILEWIKNEFGINVFQTVDYYSVAIKNECVAVIKWLLKNNISTDIISVSYNVAFFSYDLLNWIKSHCDNDNKKSNFIDDLIECIEMDNLENDWLNIAGKYGHIHILEQACYSAYDIYSSVYNENKILAIYRIAVEYDYENILNILETITEESRYHYKMMHNL